ncbi:hypothetical protein ACWDBW_28535 [Streptomyces sp. NPDC001107]
MYLGETGGDGGVGVLTGLVDGVLLISNLLPECGEVGCELVELVADLPKKFSVRTAERHLSPSDRQLTGKG